MATDWEKLIQNYRNSNESPELLVSFSNEQRESISKIARETKLEMDFFEGVAESITAKEAEELSSIFEEFEHR